MVSHSCFLNGSLIQVARKKEIQENKFKTRRNREEHIFVSELFHSSVSHEWKIAAWLAEATYFDVECRCQLPKNALVNLKGRWRCAYRPRARLAPQRPRCRHGSTFAGSATHGQLLRSSRYHGPPRKQGILVHFAPFSSLCPLRKTFWTGQHIFVCFREVEMREKLNKRQGRGSRRRDSGGKLSSRIQCWGRAAR